MVVWVLLSRVSILVFLWVISIGFCWVFFVSRLISASVSEGLGDFKKNIFSTGFSLDVHGPVCFKLRAIHHRSLVWYQSQKARKCAKKASLRMPCPSCRPFSQIGTLTTRTYLLLLPPSAEAIQSPYSRFPPTATCLALKLLTLWQRRAQQKSKWIGLPATLRWGPSSRSSNTASGGWSTHDTTRLTPTTFWTDRNKWHCSGSRQATTSSTITCILISTSVIQSSAIAVLAVRQ